MLRRCGIYSLQRCDDRATRNGPCACASSITRPVCNCGKGRRVGLCHPFSAPHFLCNNDFNRGCYFKLRRLPTGNSALFVANNRGSILSLTTRNFRTVYFGDRAIAVPPALICQLAFHFGRVILLFSVSGANERDSHGRRGLLRRFNIGHLLLPLPKAGRRGSVSSCFGTKGAHRSFLGLFVRFLSGLCDSALVVLGSYRVSFGGPPTGTRRVVSTNSIPLKARNGLFNVAKNRKANGDGCMTTVITNYVYPTNTRMSALNMRVATGNERGTILLCSARRSRMRLFGGMDGLLAHTGRPSGPSRLGTFYLANVSHGRHLRTVMRDVSGFCCRCNNVRLIIVSNVTSLIGDTGSRTRDITIVSRLCQLTNVCGAYVLYILRFIPGNLGLQKRLNDRLRHGTTAVLSVRGSRRPTRSIMGTLGMESKDPLSIPLVLFT